MTSAARQPATHDVLIVGGGPVGATLGALLARQADPAAAARVLVLERALPPPLDGASSPTTAAAGLRVSALSRASERVLAATGAWPAVAARRSAYERMHVWPEGGTPRGAGSLSFDASELAEPDLGCIVENRLLQQAALDALRSAGGTLAVGELRSLDFQADAVDVQTSTGPYRARLVVGADGAQSVARQLAGLDVRIEDYGQLAIVAVVRPQHPHEATAWQRFLGAGTLALLPLADGSCSIVWSLPEAEARQQLACDAAEFSRRLTAASQEVLGDLRLVSERAAFPLRRLLAPRYAIERFALVGDAAHVVHPLAGQGVNLGFLDAASLAERLADARRQGEDPGALRVLRSYERWRKGDNQAASAAFDGINRFLSFGRGGSSAVLQRGMGWLDGLPLAKRWLIARALGLSGELPEVARRRPG